MSKKTGKTFIHYLKDTQINFASRWLLETELSVGEISFKCGFTNSANFNRLFKEAKNGTPKELKNNL